MSYRKYLRTLLIYRFKLTSADSDANQPRNAVENLSQVPFTRPERPFRTFLIVNVRWSYRQISKGFPSASRKTTPAGDASDKPHPGRRSDLVPNAKPRPDATRPKRLSLLLPDPPGEPRSSHGLGRRPDVNRGSDRVFEPDSVHESGVPFRPQRPGGYRKMLQQSTCSCSTSLAAASSFVRSATRRSSFARDPLLLAAAAAPPATRSPLIRSHAQHQLLRLARKSARCETSHNRPNFALQSIANKSPKSLRR